MLNGSMHLWMGLRITLFALLINISATTYSLFISEDNSSAIGLLLLNALTINGSIHWFLWSVTWYERQFISFEKAQRYMDLSPEPGYVDYCKSDNWTDE